MDFFNLSKPLPKIYLKGGQTQACVKPDDTCFKPTRKQAKLDEESEQDYVLEHVRQEKAELMAMCEPGGEHSGAGSSVKGCGDLTSVCTATDLNRVTTDEDIRIYSTYLKDKLKGTNDLPISWHKSKILSLIESNEVTIITGSTGCGKTTQVPQYILDSYAEKNLYCNIVICQPRRIAAITVPKRVCDERDWPLGTICGYKVGLKECKSSETRLLYVTVGVLLQTLLHRRTMTDYTHVILDEVHEREQNLDFLLLVVKRFLYSNSRNVKVVLMSATADASKFAYYFEKPIFGTFHPAPVIHVEQESEHTIQIHYLEELRPLGELPFVSFENPKLSDSQITFGIKLIQKFDKLDRTKDGKKSVLVFLPGIHEIEEFYNALKDPNNYKPPNSGVEYKWFPVPLHSSITVEEQVQAFLPPPADHRKIILATNIAESSITVPDVMFVVDYCITKLLVTDTVSNFTSLQYCWASKANLTQRAGRAGRVMDGRVYRMIPNYIYDQLEEHAVPGMLRYPLEKIVLQAKLLDMGAPKALLALAIDPPDLTNIERTIMILKEAGGMLPTCNGTLTNADGDLTFLGRLMAEMPIDIHVTKLIALGYVFDCLEQCITIGCAMSLKSVFSNPFQSRMQSYNAKLEWADGSCSDCIAFLNAYDLWKMHQINGFFQRGANASEKNWAKRNFIQLRTLREVQALIDEVKHRLKSYNIDPAVPVSETKWTELERGLVLKFVIAGAFYPNYFTRGARGGQVDEKEAVKILSGRDPFKTVYLTNYPVNQPPDLYSNAIRKEMNDCRDEMNITYDHSKVYIEFGSSDDSFTNSEIPFKGRVPGKISMAVYRALKMRETQKHIDIKVFPHDEAHRKVNLLKKQRQETEARNAAAGTGNPPMYTSVLPGIDINYVPLCVMFIVSPSNFWAIRSDPVSDQQSNDLSRWLNGPGADISPFIGVPQVGTMCVAPYKEGNTTAYYRARLDAILVQNNETLAKVFFIDFGNSEIVPGHTLRKYGAKLLRAVEKIPARAFQCSLSMIKASPRKRSDGEWCNEAKAAFDRLVDGGKLIGSIYSIVEGVISMVLYRMDERDPTRNELNINQKLVELEFAEMCEEPYLSKMNHQSRCERQAAQEMGHSSDESREIWMKPPPRDLCNENGFIPVSLRGPHSPLEMKVYSSLQGGAGKMVSIAPTSVNSVLLDSDPQDPHERLIVAGHVSQNQSGTSLVLHNTTIMPNIHGFATLVPFVFSPVIEFRVNEKRTMYTGFICGLGPDEDGDSIFPEHDMEVIFDCEFTTEDFATVNRLRFFMGQLLTEREYPSPVRARKDIMTYHGAVKDAFLKLMARKRPSKELEYPSRQYQWKLVESNLILSDENIINCSRKTIYPVHAGVSIKSQAEEKTRMIQHLERLNAMVQSRNSKDLSNIVCQVCNMTLLNQQFLSLHLASDSHKEKANKILTMPDYS